MGKLYDLYEGDNIGGIAHIEIAHVTDFLGFNPIVFKPTKDFQELPFLPGTGMLKDEENETKNGAQYSYAGLFSIQRPANSIENILRPYIGMKSVLRITDLNGRTQIIGSPACPVELTRETDRGRRASDQAKMEFRFSVTQPHPAI